MTLKRLKIHNYMIHKDFEAEFIGNLIALTGEMGHGKSTFVGAIQFCLTGEHPPWNRADLISWGETEGSAKLYFTHEGLECSVMRKLHNSEAVLKIGEDTITGIKNVEKALTERLGVDKDIIKQIGFVQQYEIQAILFDEPSKREKAFQKLLGIGDAAKIWTELGTIIQGLTKTENFDASIESLKQIIKRLNEELGAVDSLLATSRAALDLLPAKEVISAEVTRLTKIQSHISMLEDVRTAITRLNKKITEGTAKLAALDYQKKGLLDILGCDPDEAEKAITELRMKHSAATVELNNMNKLAGASDKDGECPLCGNAVRPGQITAHISAELERLNKNECQARMIYEETYSAFTKIKVQIKSIDNESTTYRNMITTATAALDTEKEREKKILVEFASLNISPEQADVDVLKKTVGTELLSCNTALNKIEELSSQIAVMQGEKNAKSQQLQQASEMLDAKVKEKELSAPMAHKVEVLTRVRNWFHSSNGPRTMSLNALSKMTKYVNEYLKEMHSEITVTPDNQGLSFAYEYVDGRPISDPPPSTAKLSGGQKIELALAFRLAIYRYFGQKMGIMVLDEPTAHLSPAGIEYFGQLLQTVSTLARNMNLQIIMPTHEKEIMQFMDSEIHFD
jgi:DNA repair exonuclease SbcCD ATPase subunit